MKKLLVVGLLMLASCATTKASDTGVPWSNYSPGVRVRVEDQVVRRDCAALKEELLVSETNTSNQRRRVGEGNEKLSSYLVDQIDRLGCNSSSPPPAVPVPLTAPPTKQGSVSGIAYKVIATIQVTDGSLDLDLLFPSLRPGQPVVEAACTSTAKKEGAQHAYCYSTVGARKANLSDAYNTAHPGQLAAGYLGSWSSDGGFTGP